MNRDEQRAYSRGYNKGRARSEHWRQKLLALAKGYRAMAHAGIEPGECRSCAHWERGCPTCLWGYCDVAFEWSAEPWVDASPASKICTHETFGCVNWRPRADAPRR